MPFEARAFRLEILKSLIDLGSDSYKENVRINSLLEDKAQKMAGLAGVFLAAALAFIKIDTLSVWPFNRLRILVPLVLAIVLLVCCIGFCLAVMWLRSIPGLPTYESLDKLKSDLWLVPLIDLEPFEERYWGTRGALWQGVINQQVPLLKSKARRLFYGQIMLAAAMVVVAILLLNLLGPIVYFHLTGVLK
jgi:hypothetical protein